jgi:hypothetical protein
MAENNEVNFETDEVVSAESATDKLLGEANSVVSFVQERFDRSETSRYADEQRWLSAYRNYRGLYSSDVQFTSAEKSRIFVKVTKTKTLAAYGQVTDVCLVTTSSLLLLILQCYLMVYQKRYTLILILMRKQGLSH